MKARKAKGHRFGVFDVRTIRVVGGWALPMNRDSAVAWKDRTEAEAEPAPRPYPEMRRRQRRQR